MAIDAPPALPPEQIVIRRPAGRANAVLSFRRFRIHILGTLPSSSDRLQRLIEPAEDLSAAVRLLSDHYVRSGYPATQLRYMLIDDDLFLIAMLGQVVDVQAPEVLLPYFEPFVGRSPLRGSDLECARILASLHADRAGLNLAATFEPHDLDGRVLQLRDVNGDIDTRRITLGVGNPGNRFTGRHLADVLAEHGFASGDHLRLGWQTALRGLDDNQRSDRFDEFLAGWSRVTPTGLFGMQAILKQYEFRTAQTALTSAGADGEIIEVQASWERPISASNSHRWLAAAEVDYTYKRSELDDGTRLQREEYPSIEIGLSGSSIMPLPQALQLMLEARLELRHGLGKKDGDPRAVNERYLLGRPQVRAALVLDDRWELMMRGELQISRDTVPEQSQWVLGGVGYLDAYLPGVAIGDSGGLLRVELNHLETSPWLGIEWIPGIFAEYGYARFERPLPDLRPAGTAEIRDAGARVDMLYARWLRASLSIARGFGESGIGDGDLDRNKANFQFSVSASF